MTGLRIAVSACVAIACTACSIGEPVPRATHYVVEPPPPAAPAATRRSETLRMGNVRVAPAFAGNELVYRMDEVQFTSDFYHRFIAEPGPMLSGGIAGWLDRAGPFKTVAQPGSATPTQYVLEAAVTDLYGDFRPGRPPAAVMTVQFYLLEETGLTPRLALERSISRRVDLPRASPDALVRGYSKALGEILTELSSQIPPSGER